MPEEAGERLDRLLILQIDSEIGEGEGIQCVGKRRDSLLTVHPERREVGEAVLLYAPPPICRPVERRVVEAHEVTVAGEPDVGFEVLEAERRRDAECGECVLRPETSAAAVGDRQRGSRIAVTHGTSVRFRLTSTAAIRA